MLRNLRLATIAVAALAFGQAASADSVTFTGTNGSNLSATVIFTTGAGGTLTVQLTNTGTDVLNPADVLTAVFFNLAGAGTLTPGSALLAGGSTVLFGPTNGGSVGGEWAYGTGLSGAPGSATSGISSSGMGLFGNANFVPNTNLQGPASLDGLQYGITSGADNAATGNAAVTGGFALIQNSVIFTLTGLPTNYTLAGNVSGVVFQYGTALTEPNIPGGCTNCNQVPEPGTLALFGTGLASLAGLVRRRFAA